MLVELLNRPSTATVDRASSVPEGGVRGGNSLNNPATWGAAVGRGTAVGGAGGIGAGRQDWRVPALLVGGGILVVVAALLIGFQIGSKKEKQKQAVEDAAGALLNGGGADKAGGGVKDPLAGGGHGGAAGVGAGGGGQGPVVIPQVGNGGGTGSVEPSMVPTPLQDGWNYLVVATLRRAEAEQAAQYLMGEGLSVQLMPVDGAAVDRGTGGANNGRWQLWILRGVPGGEYTKRLAERQALEKRVEALGRMWKAKERNAPTDFGSVYWTKYKAP